MSASLDDLNEPMRSIAIGILSACPQAELTSTLRDIEAQAAAMAANVARNPQWIAQTYATSVVRDACQAWVDANPESDVAAGLAEVLGGFPPSDLRHLSWHLAGLAADFAPVDDPQIAEVAQKIIAAHLVAGGWPASKVLTMEGGLRRIHVQAA